MRGKKCKDKPVPFGTVDVRARALRENSSELLKEFQSARKTGNSRPETHELVFPPTCLCVRYSRTHVRGASRALGFSAFSRACRARDGGKETGE